MASSITLTDYTKVHYVGDYGAVGDGVADDRDAIQDALFAGNGTDNHIVVIPPGDYNIGTDTTNQVEDCLFYRSNTTIIIQGNLIHKINNNTQKFILCGEGFFEPVSRQENVHIIFDGGRITYPTRTLSEERKGIGITYTDYFSVSNTQMRGDDFGSWNLQIRDSNYGVIHGGVIDAGNDFGEDGIHMIQNCKGITISDFVVYAGDDALSFTQEDTISASDVIEDIVVTNCIFETGQHSAFKALIDSNATNSVIRNILVSNCYFGVQNNDNTGNPLRIETPSTNNGSVIEDITFSNCIFDGDGGPNNSNTMAISYDGVRNIFFNDCTLKNYGGRGLWVQECDSVTWNGGQIRDGQIPAADITGLTVTDIQWVSGTTVRATFSGSPDLSGVSTSNRFITISGATNPSNNGTFFITAVDDVADTIDFSVSFSRGSATDDETGITASANIGYRFGPAIEVRGGTGHTFRNFDMKDLASQGFRFANDDTTSNTPSQMLVENVHIDNCIFYGIEFFRCEESTIKGCSLRNSDVRHFIRNPNTVDNDNNVIYDNIDFDNTSGDSYFFERESTKHWNNKGTNSDFITGTVDLLNTNTTVNIDLPRETYGAYDNDNILITDIVVTPTEDVGQRWWVTVDTANRRYTINTSAAVGSDITFAYNIRKQFNP